MCIGFSFPEWAMLTCPQVECGVGSFSLLQCSLSGEVVVSEFPLFESRPREIYVQGATRLCVSSPFWAPGSALPWDVGCCGPAHRGLMGSRRDVEGWGPEAVEKGLCQERLLEQCTWRGRGEQLGNSGSFRRCPLIRPDLSCTFPTRGRDPPCRLGHCCDGPARAQWPWWPSPSPARCEVPCAPLQSPLDSVGTSRHQGGGGAQ